jgi:hypothetical protein
LERKSKGRRQASRPQDIAEGGRAKRRQRLAFAEAERPTAKFKMAFSVFRSFRSFEHTKNHLEFSEQSYDFFIFF